MSTNIVKGYANRTIRALTDCAAGRRDIVIADGSKSEVGLGTLHVTARELGLEASNGLLVSDNGETVGHTIFGRNMDDVKTAFGLIESRKAGNISRESLQLQLGKMLGYGICDILSFSLSEIGKTCPCDCCGGAQ